MAHQPTIKQLRYFVALDQYRHFRRAADACFVSQPAFSIAIRELEKLLDARLVDRTHKNVTITSIGKEVAVQARLVLRDLDALVELARGHQAPLSGQLKLGVIPTVAPFLLPKVLPPLKKAYPGLRLHLKEDLTDRIYQHLMQGELDLILVALPYEFRNTERMILFRDPFYFACRKGSRLVESEQHAVEQLPAESILLLEDGHCLRDHALSACKIRNADKLSRMTATSILTLIEMIDSDLGITYLPEMARNSPLLKRTHIQTFPMKAGSFREIGLVWRRGSQREPEFRLFGEFVRQRWTSG
jgi:LysR family hydrogen peroxide-inducible transcriptional activator